MAVHASKVLEQARSLTPEQRLDLAAELLASVDGEPPETWEVRRAELNEHMVEMETGAAALPSAALEHPGHCPTPATRFSLRLRRPPLRRGFGH
jgi:hypothetical protein